MNAAETKITQAVSYEYPIGGQYNETVAKLIDGRTAWINTQYGTVDVRHADECAISKQTACYPKAKCTCGAMELIDVEALVDDARANGKTGYAPQAETKTVKHADVETHEFGLCEKCGTYCYGDCEVSLT